ncbi:putative D-alanine--D-alanine ligase Ddl [Shewanella benthica]|uniref:Putative D-alanine--D-alanine ligase Ddl n=1 Tax=Shewanella benthica TaxID=43661 RepID=A0A330M5H8_9GAMM|nr:D-alanine--D-alanine ligase [Shewanella benthica]SQH77531.1 putative D-alanine--D-alanine ligase Ddl [Shewanella benthica]
MNIEIVTTANEGLKETGFGSLKACKSVFDSMVKAGYAVNLNLCVSREDLDEIVARQPSLVVLAVKYIPLDNENDIWLADYFADHGINFTGSSRDVLDFDSNKVSAKDHLSAKGIATARYFTAIPGQYKNEHELPITFPLFLKPLDAANGNGVDDSSFVTNFLEFEAKIASLDKEFNHPTLVEEYLPGREFTVAIIQASNNQLLVSPIELVPPESKNGLRILGAKVKKDDSEELRKIDDDAIKTRVKALAIECFVHLGVRDYGRIDILADKSGQCFFIEANLVPGMTSGSSYFPLACEIEHQLTYDEVVNLIIEQGLSRAGQESLG